MNLGKIGNGAAHGWLFALVLVMAGCGQAPDNASDTDATGKAVAVESPIQAGATDQAEVTVPEPVSVKMCGGIADITCDADDYCHYADGMCGMGDVSGECRPMPQFCTMEYDPYCGCDGNTYGNRCDTHAVGQSIRHQGACIEPEG